MNIWAEKSFNLAKEDAYLDMISVIYPAEHSEREDRLDNFSILEIRKLLDTQKPKELISYLIDLDRFPFDDPYVGFIRHFKNALIKNPKTADRLWTKLNKLGIESIIEGINRPKSASRKFGGYFSSWLHKKYEALNDEDFLKSGDKIVVLSGGDKTLKKFSKSHLGYKRKKGLDFVIKIKNTYVIGEAKFVSHSGGTQDKSVREVIDLVTKNKSPAVIKVGLLDGVSWVASSTLYQSLHKLKDNENIMSVLYLDDFLNSLRSR